MNKIICRAIVFLLIVVMTVASPGLSGYRVAAQVLEGRSAVVPSVSPAGLLHGQPTALPFSALAPQVILTNLSMPVEPGATAAAPSSARAAAAAAQATRAVPISPIEAAAADAGRVRVEIDALTRTGATIPASAEAPVDSNASRLGLNHLFDLENAEAGADVSDPAEAAAPAAKPSLRPISEWWTIGDRRYDSTAELVDDWKGRVGKDEPAVYHFRDSKSRVPGPRELAVTGTALNGAAGAFIGGIVSFALTALFAVVGAAGNLIGAVYGNHGGGFPLAFDFLLAAPIAIGAVIGLSKGPGTFARDYNDATTIPGRIATSQDPSGVKVTFSVDAPVAASVDLAEHAKAVVFTAPPARSRISDIPKGIGLMAASILAAITLIGNVFSFFGAASMHAPLADRVGDTPHVGYGLALVVLANIGMAAFVNGASNPVNGYADTWQWPVLAAVFLVSALWGRFVLPRLRAQEAVLKAQRRQWWAVASKKSK